MSNKKSFRALSSKGYQVSTPLRSRSESECDVSSMTDTQRSRTSFSLSCSTQPDESAASYSTLADESEGDQTCFEEPEGDSLTDLYDEYLLGRLLLMRSQEKRASVEKHVKSEVSNMLSALQNLQAEQKAAQDADTKIQAEKAKIEVYKEVISTPTSKLEATCDSIHRLALGLESRHARLKVEGGTLFKDNGGDPKALVQETLKLLSHLKSRVDYPKIQSLSNDFESLESQLSEVYKSWDEFQGKSEQASDLLTRLESLKLSLEESQEPPESLLKINVPSPLEDDI